MTATETPSTLEDLEAAALESFAREEAEKLEALAKLTPVELFALELTNLIVSGERVRTKHGWCSDYYSRARKLTHAIYTVREDEDDYTLDVDVSRALPIANIPLTWLTAKGRVAFIAEQTEAIEAEKAAIRGRFVALIGEGWRITLESANDILTGAGWDPIPLTPSNWRVSFNETQFSRAAEDTRQDWEMNEALNAAFFEHLPAIMASAGLPAEQKVIAERTPLVYYVREAGGEIAIPEIPLIVSRNGRRR